MALFVTICLVKYNKFNVTTFGDYSFLIIKDENFSDYKKGDLVVVYKNSSKEINEGDNLFYYNIKEQQDYIQYGAVKTKTQLDDNTATYVMSNDYKLTSDYIIGKGQTSKVYNNLGGILAFLESGLGYLIFVVIPALLILVKVARTLKREMKEEAEQN